MLPITMLKIYCFKSNIHNALTVLQHTNKYVKVVGFTFLRTENNKIVAYKTF